MTDSPYSTFLASVEVLKKTHPMDFHAPHTITERPERGTKEPTAEDLQRAEDYLRGKPVKIIDLLNTSPKVP